MIFEQKSLHERTNAWKLKIPLSGIFIRNSITHNLVFSNLFRYYTLNKINCFNLFAIIEYYNAHYYN